MAPFLRRLLCGRACFRDWADEIDEISWVTWWLAVAAAPCCISYGCSSTFRGWRRKRLCGMGDGPPPPPREPGGAEETKAA